MVESSNCSRYTNTKENEVVMEDNKDFTLIHIPDSDHSTLDNIAPTEFCDKLNELDMTESQIMETLESFQEIQTKELNLDLLVRAYEMLLSSNDANLLIKNWLEKQTEEHCKDLTLEDNLKLFVSYCENLPSRKNI